MIFGSCIAELSDSDLKDPCSNEGNAQSNIGEQSIWKHHFSVLNMRFGSECEEKKPINPMALAIISQISNKSMILITYRGNNRITYTPFSEWTV